MTIIATIRCSSMGKLLAFYTQVLDFERVDGDDELDGATSSVLSRDGDQLFLSSHRGDGVFGSVVVVMNDDVDALFRKYRERGLRTPGNPEAPRHVHEGPIDQSWGNARVQRRGSRRQHLRFTQG